MKQLTNKSQDARVKQRETIRDRLLEAVERLLADGQSYPELTVEQLAREAQLTRTTFYTYFGDKADLLRAWLEQLRGELEIGGSRWWQLDAGSTREDLRAVLVDAVTSYQPHALLLSAAYETSLFDDTVDEVLREIATAAADSLQEHIERGQRDGWVDPDLYAEETAVWLTWMWFRGQQQLGRADERELEQIAEGFTNILVKTLYAPAQRA
jgi:TetR/AcrR family transcriptional regulator, ethionamide resistance regulator